MYLFTESQIFHDQVHLCFKIGLEYKDTLYRMGIIDTCNTETLT